MKVCIYSFILLERTKYYNLLCLQFSWILWDPKLDGVFEVEPTTQTGDFYKLFVFSPWPLNFFLNFALRTSCGGLDFCPVYNWRFFILYCQILIWFDSRVPGYFWSSYRFESHCFFFFFQIKVYFNKNTLTTCLS